MNQPLLTIQIPYTKDRMREKDLLESEFQRQISVFGLHDLIHIQIDGRGKEVPIGQKRNDLYQLALGKYVVQWDSDDWIAADGLYWIIEACKKDVDVVTYKELCVMNGIVKQSDHSLFYNKWEDNFNGWDFVRTPFFKNPIRTEIAKQVQVPPIRFNEDEQFSYAIKPLLQTEHDIDQFIYHYIYSPKDTHEERYGLNK